MVFSGKPSKACQRCRKRRLKCDLFDPCGQCVRASVTCSGYSHVNQLRIRDETHSVQLKAICRTKIVSPEPQYLPLSLDSQARDVFFAHYVSGPAGTWDFLQPFYNSADSPDYLTQSIDAVSLAYLSHQVSSSTTLTTSRERYISALRLTGKAIENPGAAAKNTILLTSLLLDLFEKITNNDARLISSWSSHVNGALALVRLRGLEDFHDKSALRVLVRLSTNFLISCVATNAPVPEELSTIREHAQRYLGIDDPKWRMSNLMIEYANLRSKMSSNVLSSEVSLSQCLELDGKFRELAINMPESWRYKTVHIEEAAEAVYSDYFDIYPERHITQVWNVMRSIRIHLNEAVLDLCKKDSTLERPSSLSPRANENIKTSAQDICASVPQYLGSYNPTAPTSNLKIPPTSTHDKASPRALDCYSLILPLYVAARSTPASSDMRAWVMKQMNAMSSVYGIKNAGIVCNVLAEGRDVSPWAIYAMLGSYAFAA